MVLADIKQAIVKHLGEILNLDTVSGGDTHQTFRLIAESGEYFLKQSQAYLPDVFYAEARDLELLTRLDLFKVPQVILVGDRFVILEYLELDATAKSTSQAHYDLGVVLAKLHQIKAKQYGFETDNYIGVWPQKNKPSLDWSDFYWHQRLLPQLDIAKKNHNLSSEIESLFGKLYKQLPRLLPKNVEASLVHGDFWSGNWAVFKQSTTNQPIPVIFDPALYCGHREVDVAMARLFGGFLPDFYQGYQATWPLESDYQVRQHIYQLYPLLTHLNSFGHSYQSQLVDTLKLILA